MKPRFFYATLVDGSPVAINVCLVTSVLPDRDNGITVVCFEGDENFVKFAQPFADFMKTIDPPATTLDPTPPIDLAPDPMAVFSVVLHNGPPGPGYDQNVVGKGRLGDPIAPDPKHAGRVITGISLFGGDQFLQHMPLDVPRKIVPGDVYSLL